MSSTKTRSVSDPNKKSSANFLWVLLALLLVAALVIGLVVWQSQGKRTSHLAERDNTEVNAVMEYNPADGAITLKSQSAGENAEEVGLYEDYSCPHCGELANATDERMLQEIDNGKLVVNVHPLNFLDRNAEGHSTASLAALLALADKGETNAWWNLREVIFEEQQDIYNQWSDDDFANAAKELGASEDAVKAIRDGAYIDEAKKIAETNANYLQEKTGNVSSPRILQDGKDVEVQDPAQWIDKVLS
ncbi:DsbA family protein [Corynebacterium tapiri]|uniref:Thioredoxin-like fold domain-containing protein n=1 Tax=Corynebacterium tapiri TaxID=1448266 RepID=A0A5C4U2P2_9CORY|nr:thioredoxin domain-containing protein [Corynebacterium tapiri]TNL95624.1 hypothetical protein FHE74_09255 [Corynebacterium tapiri]